MPHRVYQLQGTRYLADNPQWDDLQQFRPVFAPGGEIKVAPLNQFQAHSGFFRMRLAGDQ